MADGIEVNFKGLDKLYSNLEAFSRKEVLVATKDGLEAVGDMWADSARSKAPDGDSGMLKASIGHIVQMKPSRGYGVVRVGPMQGLGKVKQNDRTSDPSIYGAFLEWGHKIKVKITTWLGNTKYAHHKTDGQDTVVQGKPYLVPTYDTESQNAIDLFVETVKTSLKL